MVPDPYKALNLPHSASAADIKRRYRELARRYHPDRMMNASEEEQIKANLLFAEIAGAYGLLTDPQRKAQYDHIYKFGGYDQDDDDDVRMGYRRSNGQEIPSRTGANNTYNNNNNRRNSGPSSSRKRKSVGVGYSCTDPLAFLWTQGRIHSTTNVAGIQIPSRFQMGYPGGGGGLRVSFSTGEYRFQNTSNSTSNKDGNNNGNGGNGNGDGGEQILQFKSRTTQFAHGKKYTRTETTTIHKDGKKEVLIEEGDDYVERRTSNVQQMASHDQEHQLPWYMSAWAGIKDKLSMCYSPCQVQ